MSDHAMTTWSKRLLDAIHAQPKKTVMLSLLVVIMAVVWFRTVSGSSGPAHADASSILPPARLGPAAPPVAPSPSSEAMNRWLQDRVHPLTRNLFEVKLDYFPQEPGKAAPAARIPTGDDFWSRLEKSMLAKADQEKARQHRIENMKLQAAALELQSTMISQGTPKALINGKLYGEGEIVASEFRLMKIEARRIIIEREGIRLEVLFK
jgi:hypothetical protein